MLCVFSWIMKKPVLTSPWKGGIQWPICHAIYLFVYTTITPQNDSTKLYLMPYLPTIWTFVTCVVAASVHIVGFTTQQLELQFHSLR